MDSFRDLLPHVGMLLAGGLLTSLGFGQLARTARGRAVLGRLPGRAMVGLVVGVVAVSGAGLYWMGRTLLSDARQGAVPDPGPLFAFGALVGLAFSLPALVVTWSGVRADARRVPREAPATREERRAFAVQLADQIRDVQGRDADVAVSVGGDGDRILRFDRGLDSQQGEKLVDALRHEMRDLGFKRVEGSGPGGDWWTRV